MEPSWNLTSRPPRTTPEPIWAETPKLPAVGGEKKRRVEFHQDSTRFCGGCGVVSTKKSTACCWKCHLSLFFSKGDNLTISVAESTQEARWSRESIVRVYSFVRRPVTSPGQDDYRSVKNVTWPQHRRDSLSAFFVFLLCASC